MINGCKISDRISIKELLHRYNIPSVNQLSAKIKLTEVCKSSNILSNSDYPIQMENNNLDRHRTGMSLRPSSHREFNEDRHSKAPKESFSRNAAKILTQAPD